MLARPAVENGSFFRLEAIVPAAPKPRCSQPYFEGDSGDEGTQGTAVASASPILHSGAGLACFRVLLALRRPRGVGGCSGWAG